LRHGCVTLEIVAIFIIKREPFLNILNYVFTTSMQQFPTVLRQRSTRMWYCR